MALDIAEQIGTNAKSLMRLVSEIDEYSPDEATVEVLIDAFDHWTIVEARLLFPALAEYADEGEQLVEAAELRVEALQAIRDDIRLEEGADAPYSELASKYVAGIKYHLIVDVEDILPQTMQIPGQTNTTIARQMVRLRTELDNGGPDDELL